MSRFLIGTFFCLLLSLNGFTQKVKGYFYVTGKIKVEQGLVDGTNIQVFRDEALLNNVAINRTGSFRIAVDFEHVYRFNFSKEGYYAKTIEIDTHIPSEVCDQNCQFPPYQLSLMLYNKVPGVSDGKVEVGRISYNPKVDNFDAELLRKKSILNVSTETVLAEMRQKSTVYEKQAQKTKELKYNETISKADRLFEQKAYKQAMSEYRDAVLLSPEIKYPRNRVNQLYQLLIAAELKESFGEANTETLAKYINYGIQKADEREYSMAKVAFEIAQKVNPDDPKVKNKLFNVEQEFLKLQQLALTEVEHRKVVYLSRTSKYRDLVAKADAKFKQEAFAESKDFYAQAITQIEENSYAMLMLRKIEALMADNEAAIKLAVDREAAEKDRLRKARGQAYDDAVAEADRLFNQRLYRDAIEYYELALTIKNYEIHPQKQIKLIKGILANLQLKGEEYNALIRNGDALMYSKKYSEARIVFVKAHELIPDEVYAKQKIKRIDELLKKSEQEETFKEKYDSLIASADQYFLQKNYTEAISGYQKASELLPQEVYPKTQIKKIRQLLSGEDDAQKKLLQLQADFERTLKMADDAFDRKSYVSARSLYNEALLIIPNQEYPKSQLRKIENLLKIASETSVTKTKLEQIDFSNLQNVSQEDRLAAYKEAMALGEAFMKSKDWGVARFYYRRALALVPNDEVATQKLSVVDRSIRGDNVNESKYKEMIQKADEAFKTGDFSVARFYYGQASEAKPGDAYVQERIDVVIKLSENTASRVANREFDTSMNKANAALEVKNYSVARFFYRKALSLKPDDVGAKQKLEEVERIINP
jgi:tetratricopeptide (TPR) repeat protein